MEILSYSIDLLLILLISLTLIFVGKNIGGKSNVYFGHKIPQDELDSPKGVKGLRIIKHTFLISGTTTLLGGLLCLIIENKEAMFWILLAPISIAVTIIALVLYTIHGNKKWGMAIVVITIGLTIAPLLIIYTPTISNENKVHIDNDTLFIDGEYSKKIPISEITLVEKDVAVPPIKLRTNGISLGSRQIGYFLTEENAEVILSN